MNGKLIVEISECFQCALEDGSEADVAVSSIQQPQPICLGSIWLLRTEWDIMARQRAFPPALHLSFCFYFGVNMFLGSSVHVSLCGCVCLSCCCCCCCCNSNSTNNTGQEDYLSQNWAEEEPWKVFA